MYNRDKYVGEVFGEVTVLSFVESKSSGAIYLGQCSCGTVKEFYIGNLRTSKSTSCGCVAKKLLSERLKTHGEKQTRLYRIWTNMKSRCYNPRVSSYRYYGAMGISVCAEWKNSYETFRDWALGNGYSDDLSLERINISEDYCPSNCKWATDIEQARNRSITWFVTINGETKTAKEWCEQNNVNYKTAHTRKSRGWNEIDAVTKN